MAGLLGEPSMMCTEMLCTEFEVYNGSCYGVCRPGVKVLGLLGEPPLLCTHMFCVDLEVQHDSRYGVSCRVKNVDSRFHTSWFGAYSPVLKVSRLRICNSTVFGLSMTSHCTT